MALEGGWRSRSTPLLILSLKKKFGGIFSSGDFSCEVGGTFHQNRYNIPRTYERMDCKVEPYRFSVKRDPSVKKDTKTGIHSSMIRLSTNSLTHYVQMLFDILILYACFHSCFVSCKFESE